MNDRKAWWIGLLIIIFFVFIAELTVIFRIYVYDRMGLSRNYVLSILWLLPITASFLVVYLSKKRRILKGLSYIFILSTLGPLAHLLAGHFGATIDFPGITGLKITFQIYLVLSTLTIGFGTLIGIFFNNRRKTK